MMRKYRILKILTSLLFTFLGIGILTACSTQGVRKAPTSSQVEDTSAVQEDKTLKKEDISNEISKGGKVLFDKKVFTREDIWKGADEEFQVYAASVPDITNTSVYLPVSICYPETDDGFTFLLALSKDGSSKVYPVPMAWDESDMVTDFYVRYTHECQQKPVDKASLLKLARDYGSPAFVEQLTKGGTQIVYPTKVLARKDMKVVPEAELLKDGCRVNFSTSYDNTHPFDSIRVELKRRSVKKDYDYEYMIDKVIH